MDSQQSGPSTGAGPDAYISMGNVPPEPIEFVPLQEFLLAHMTVLEFFYFVLFFLTVVYLATRFLLIPLFKDHVRS